MSINRAVLYATALAAGLLVSGCDESEQGRILRYEQGVYLGTPDAQLSAEQIEGLRQRAALQGAN